MTIRRVTSALPSLKQLQAGIAIVVAVVGGLWGGWWAFENKFARATDLAEHKVVEQQHYDGTKALILQGDLRELRRERSQLLIQKDRAGKLTPNEKERLDQIEEDKTLLEQKIKRLAPEK